MEANVKTEPSALRLMNAKMREESSMELRLYYGYEPAKPKSRNWQQMLSCLMVCPFSFVLRGHTKATLAANLKSSKADLSVLKEHRRREEFLNRAKVVDIVTEQRDKQK